MEGVSSAGVSWGTADGQTDREVEGLDELTVGESVLSTKS